MRIDLKVMIIRNRDPFRINTLRAALASVSWDCLSSSLFEEEKKKIMRERVEKKKE